MVVKMKYKNLPEALILALGDPIKQAKLGTICYRLSELDRRGRPHDYALEKETSWLEYLQYGISGFKFSKINILFKK